MYKSSVPILAVIFSLAFLLPGCGSKRPILYPNEYLKKVGNQQAQADIDECIRLATEYGAKEDAGKKIAQDTAGSAAVGAAAGAAISAVLGGDVGRSAAAGGAGAGAGRLTRSVIDSGDPDPVFRGYVEKCLREKGYETVGWK